MSFQTCKTFFVHLQNTNEDIFDGIWELSDSNDITMINAQKT